MRFLQTTEIPTERDHEMYLNDVKKRKGHIKKLGRQKQMKSIL